MSLSTYKAFLASLSPSALADDASLHYVTTLTTLQGATAISKHYAVQDKLLKRKGDKILSVVDGGNSLSVDVETTLEFIHGGGAYLPGLDDNFVADRVVTFHMIHIVHFNEQGKIHQIRLYWDQGSLLKQIEVIGARARNWPIRDGKDQIRLVASSAKIVPSADSSKAGAARGEDEVSVRSSRSRGSTTNAMNDPHASLQLFQARDVNRESSESRPAGPRTQSMKPPPRDLGELFVDEASAAAANPNDSPAKHGIPTKSGGGRNFKSNRLFDEAGEEETAPTPMSSVKTNAKKYSHFEFGDGEDTPKVKEGHRSSRSHHQSNWDFEDFNTPAKTKTKILSQNVRHFGWSDDEVSAHYEPQSVEEEGSPIRRPVVHKARPDADAHFDFEDEATPEGQRKLVSNKGRNANKGMGLYKDHVLGSSGEEEGANPGDNKRGHNDVTTHVRNDSRKKDFAPHFEMADNSPSHGKTDTKAAVPEIKKKAIQTNWKLYDDTPGNRGGINVAGNGMGGRKGTEFSLYEDEPEDKTESRHIKSMGNGMGGRKGTKSGNFDWDF
ncbi:unnamed protein product [Periconia digitata]|uniref:NTF2-like protein n=1 Tax=Periconia digitata TaxID=1303443 RepID=A0A9W4XSV2_9PLEO|nr:unnamed protein product [Periconia digitata]